MSYFDESITHANFVDTFAMTPLLHDIAAMQRLYGANNTTRTGDTVYGFNSNAGRSSYLITPRPARRVRRLGRRRHRHARFLRLRAAADHHARGKILSVGGLEFNVAIARGTVIENAVGGSGWDTITGNAASNILSGGGRQ